jgi:hypothetical protein
MKHSRKKIHVSADTPALRQSLARIFKNFNRENHHPFSVEMIESLDNAEEIHLLFFEADPQRMDDSKKALERLLATFRANVVLISSTEYDNLELARQSGIGNILLSESMNEPVVRAITLKLLGKEFFGFDPFFPDGYPLFEKEYSFSGRFQLRDFQKKYFGDFAASLDPDERDSFYMYASELMTNALSYGVYGISPEERDKNQTGFPPDPDIPEGKEIRVRIVRDKEKYAVSITDKTGSLTLERVLEKIRRQTIAPGEDVPKGLYDLSGRGFFILSKQTRLIINILKRVKTEVILLRYNDPSLNKYQSLIINEKEK